MSSAPRSVSAGDPRQRTRDTDVAGMEGLGQSLRPHLGAVVLTTGERPVELAEALASIRRQREVTVAIVVVLNRDDGSDGRDTKDSDTKDSDTKGSGPEDKAATDGATSGLGSVTDVLGPLGDDVEVVTPGRNLGIPAGRNLGMRHVPDDVVAVVFLDDDARLVDETTLATVAQALATDERLAVVTMRIADPVTGRTERRHVPRVRVGDPSRSSWVTTFLGGACVIRADAYREAGGLPEMFFYAHEETSLAWQLIDAGWRIRYRGDLVVEHPAAAPSRHAEFHRLSARNRVLLAHLHLPFMVAAVYVGTWTVLSIARAPRALPTMLRGIREGLAMRHLKRTPIRWRTIGRLTRYGRPPII